MADEVARPKVVLEVDHRQAIANFLATGEASKELGAAVAALGKQFSSHAEQSSKSEKSIRRLMDSISGAGATAKFDELAVAVTRLGGAEKLTATQTDLLAKQIEKLKAAGGAVPASLQGVAKSAESIAQNLGLSGAASAQATAQMQSMAGQLGPLGSALGALGPYGMAAAAGLAALGGGIAILGNLAKEAVAYGSKLSDLSLRTGTSTEGLQLLEFAGSRVGVSMETASAGIQKFQNVMETSPEKVEALGLSIEELKGMAPEAAFEKFAMAIAEIDDPAERSAAAMSVLGKSAGELMPLLRSMGDDAASTAARLNTVLSGEVIAQLDAVDDATSDAQSAWDGLMRQLGASIVISADVAGAISGIAEAIGLASRAAAEYGPALTKMLTGGLGARGAIAVITGGASEALARFAETEPVRQFEQYGTRASAAQMAAFNEANRIGVPTFDITDEASFTMAEMQREPGKYALDISSYDESIKANKELADAIEKARIETKQANEAEKKRQADLKKSTDEIERAKKAEEKALQKTNEKDMLEALNDYYDKIDEKGIYAMEPLKIQPKEFIGSSAMMGLATINKDQAAAGQKLEAQLKDVNKEFEKSGFGTEKVVVKTKDWAQELQNVANAAQFMPSIFGDILGAVSGTATAIKGMDLSGKGGKGFSLMGEAGNLGGLLSNISGGIQIAGLALNLGKTLHAAFTQTETEKIAKDVGRDFGVKISEELAKTIEEEGRGRFDGALLHLGEMIEEAGGMQKFGAARAAGGLRDLFSAVDRGTVSIQEAGTVFDEVFGETAAAHISSTTGIASAQLRELVLLAKDFGLESQALREFMKGQAVGLAGSLAGGLGSMKAAREGAADKAATEAERRARNAALALGKTQQEAEEAGRAAGARAGREAPGGLAGAGAAAGISSAIVGDVAAMRAAGMSQAEALEAITPAVAAMREELKAAGLEGSAAFLALEAQIKITTGEITGPLVTGIGSFSASLVNLHNMNMLTQEDFAGITSQIGANILALEEQGIKGPEAAQALAPDLQKIWEIQQATGFAVDATTQEMINQAVTAGMVGEEHRSAADKMADASERTAKAIEFLASRFGYLTAEMNKTPEKKDITVTTHYESEGEPPPGVTGAGGTTTAAAQFAGGSGGFQDFGSATPAFLHGFEAVITPSDFRSIASTSMAAGAEMMARGTMRPTSLDSSPIGASAMHPLTATAGPGGGGTSSSAGAIVININGANKDPKQIADEVAYVLTRGNSPALLDEIRKRARS
jgi:hypothetical protein